MRFNRAQVMATLKEINDRVMAKHGTPVSTQEAYPTIKRVFTEAQDANPDIKAVIDSGILDKTSAVTDEDKAKVINDELEYEIKRAIRMGKLPSPDRDPQFKKWNNRKAKRK